MKCKFCLKAIDHTFASLFSFKKVHPTCHQILQKGKDVIVYPFLEGFLYIEYLLDQKGERDLLYFERFYLRISIERMIKADMLILFLQEEITKEDLYLLFLLSNQRLYWVFLVRPDFLE
jgi:hypothetical protein